MRIKAMACVMGCAMLCAGLMAHAQATNTFPASGNVGVGTTSPATKLDVEGGDVLIGGGSLHVPGNGNGTDPPLHFTSDAPSGFNPGGNIGFWLDSSERINTNAQFVVDAKGFTGLLINGNANNFVGSDLNIVRGSSASGVGEAPDIQLDDNGGDYHYIIQGSSGGLQFFENNASTENQWLEQMRMTPSGNVGIGTASPSAKLEVDGNIKLTAGSGASITFPDGSVQSTAYTGVACGGDYAESVDVTGDRHHYGPGDLLVLDSNHPGDVLKSAKPYSTSIAGIYSTKPGYVGRRQTGPKSPNEVPMAMVGIVPAHVTAENGPIHVGDLLVSSSIPGYAMKGTDRSRMLGAVVGKAAGNLNSGKGVIEVLVTLQ